MADRQSEPPSSMMLAVLDSVLSLRLVNDVSHFEQAFPPKLLWEDSDDVRANVLPSIIDTSGTSRALTQECKAILKAADEGDGTWVGLRKGPTQIQGYALRHVFVTSSGQVFDRNNLYHPEHAFYYYPAGGLDGLSFSEEQYGSVFAWYRKHGGAQLSMFGPKSDGTGQSVPLNDWPSTKLFVDDLSIRMERNLSSFWQAQGRQVIKVCARVSEDILKGNAALSATSPELKEERCQKVRLGSRKLEFVEGRINHLLGGARRLVDVLLAALWLILKLTTEPRYESECEDRGGQVDRVPVRRYKKLLPLLSSSQNVGYTNYFHWLTTALPRLLAQRYVWTEDPEVFVLTPPVTQRQDTGWGGASYIEESLDAIGLPANRRAPYDVCSLAFAEMVHTVGAYAVNGNPSRQTVKKLREALGHLVPTARAKESATFVALLVDRPGAKRRLQDPTRVRTALKSGLGSQWRVTWFRPKLGATLASQVVTFSEVHAVVGVDGAALVNLIFVDLLRFRGVVALVPAKEPYHAGLVPVLPCAGCGLFTNWLVARSLGVASWALLLQDASFYGEEIPVPPEMLHEAGVALAASSPPRSERLHRGVLQDVNDQWEL